MITLTKIFQVYKRTTTGNGWTLYNNEFYVKGADGKDLATYQGSELEDWYVWGNDLTGKIRKDKPYYYFKDHLGSVRAIVKNDASVVAAYDYDAWGYPLEGRTFNADSMKFKYTGKEFDKESLYDYFGARYYDARIGRWGQVEPLKNNYNSRSPYNYCSNDPLSRIDLNGLDDFYYTIGKQYKRVKNDSGDDRYFVRNNNGNYEFEGNNYFQANSEQTVKLYPNWKNVDVNFSNYKLITAFINAIPPEGSDIFSAFTYTLTESVGGRMDQKEFVLNDEETLFIFDYIAFNKNEAGNIIWGAVMNYLGFSEEFTTSSANISTILRRLRFDELEEQLAMRRGWYYYDSDLKQFFKSLP